MNYFRQVKSQSGLRVGIACCLIALLAACNSVPPPPEKSSIIGTDQRGFSPLSDRSKRTIDFKIDIGEIAALKAWTISIVGGGGEVWTKAGTANDAPSLISWDGNALSGSRAADGTYTAVMRLDFGKKFSPETVESSSFILAAAPPRVGLAIDPAEAIPQGARFVAPVSLRVSAESGLAAISSWSLDFQDSSGKSVRTFVSDWPVSTASWDGAGAGGEAPVPETSYSLVLSVWDEFGNKAVEAFSLSVGRQAAAAGEKIAPPAAPEGCSLSARARGLSPNGDKVSDSLAFDAAAGSIDAVEAWKIAISAEGGGVVRTLSGTRNDLTEPVAWNGRDDAGQLCVDGRYGATLTIDYGKKYAAATATSESFLLVASAPVVSCALSPKFFSPDGDGIDDELEVRIDAKNGLAAMESWTARILDQGESLFAERAGRWPETSFAWDGKGKDGSLVESASDYRVEITARDEFGNVGKAQGVARVDILVTETATGYKIRVPSVVFKAYTADYRDVPAESRERNIESLDNLAAKLAKFPGYKILIVGHASMVYWNNPAKGKVEQEKVLIPLSKARSAAIKKALVERGIEAARIETDGTGAEDPVVPDSDTKNRWKNRRVEFFLNK